MVLRNDSYQKWVRQYIKIHFSLIIHQTIEKQLLKGQGKPRRRRATLEQLFLLWLKF